MTQQPGQKTRVPKPAPLTAALTPPVYDVADASALQALNRGDANSDQQKRALYWIMDNAAQIKLSSYRGGVDGDRETAMLEGRKFVGLWIANLLTLNLSSLRGM